ncbi:GGDEF domain-containing protein [Altericroceibacterium spongiae]|uniref:diguanylate cyclase n=1 Tax=Altericroceibacterium spongiae TaxID=2320269 RepID=A0A420EK46_9SPHN|nr:GGDEF domain-containing protein [Altericroceibacterium spongiae]RKF21065.1 GGDEF domain-containing protein [Altericroceibacterium spongiae]
MPSAQSSTAPGPAFSGYADPDVTTIIACVTALSAVICLISALFWLKEGRHRNQFWYVAPFASGVIAGIMLGYPAMFSYLWALRIGHTAVIFSYGAAWQASRVLCSRPTRPVPVIVTCALWFIYMLSYVHSTSLLTIAPMIYAVIIGGFSALAAMEFRQLVTPRLPSATMLFWIFASYAAINFIRVPLAWFLPAPLGPYPPTWWSIAIFALLAVMHGILTTAFMIAFAREKLAAENYLLALIDPLTGVGNRRALKECTEALTAHLPEGSLVGCITFDIDRFKTINDRFGHDFGDKVIALAAKIACRTVGSDNVFRTGGEEFACILCGPHPEDGIAAAERLRSDFEHQAQNIEGVDISATISVGVAIGNIGREWGDLLKQADTALYEAKCSGRNRTILAKEDNPVLDNLSIFPAQTSRPTG